MSICPCTPDVSKARVDDLKARLRAARWLQHVTQDFSHGQAVPLVQQLAEHWAESF